MASVQTEAAPPICCQQVARINWSQNPPECELLNGSRIALPRLIAAHISSGDEISFPLLNSAVTIGTEIYVSQNSLAGSSRAIYQAPISYVTQPHNNKRGDLYVAAQVCAASVGISSILISCQTLREYFYDIPRIQDHPDRRTFYDILRIPSAVCAAELRVAFKLRQLELQAKNAPRNEHSSVERAFNILGDPELRACYDRLLRDPEAPALFPYGGFGSLLVSGERSRNRNTFFAHCIIAFLPEQHHRRFRAPLRKCDFYADRAVYRDIRRKLELWIDPAVLHTSTPGTRMFPAIHETGETSVNNSKSQNIGLKTPSSIEPIDPDKPKPIREWQQKYERYLGLIGRKATRERYARALERFLGKHQGKIYAHQFLRPVINTYVETRLAEGASAATVRLELSAVRGLFQFAMDMGASDVMFNPAKNVRVRKTKGGSPAGIGRNEVTESPA